MKVSPTSVVHPGNVIVRAYVRHDAANRLMEVAADSSGFFRSSMVELEGAEAPFEHDFIFRDLPEGEYTVVAVLTGRDGKVRAYDSRPLLVF